MFTYSFTIWIFIFYIYCFLGWIIESSIVSIRTKKLVNRGFLKIPMLPIYGFGSVMMLFVSLPIKDKPILIYFVGMIAATILEYISAVLIENIFKIKYWDYTEDKFNFQGRICLESSLFWGVLSVALTLFIHKPVENFVLSLKTNTIYIIVFIISIIFIIDFIISTKNALDFNKLLSFIYKIKTETENLKLQIENKSKDYKTLIPKVEKLNKDYQEIFIKLKNRYSNMFISYPRAKSLIFNDTFKNLKNKYKEFMKK